MAEFDVGQTFLDLAATNFSGTKGKYFIALSNAEFDDDPIICFVMNSEYKMEKHKLGCNQKDQKFIIEPQKFSFIERYTSIMLVKPARYFLREMYYSNIKLLDKADLLLCRQIKNCIDWSYIDVKFAGIIKESYK